MAAWVSPIPSQAKRSSRCRLATRENETAATAAVCTSRSALTVATGRAQSYPGGWRPRSLFTLSNHLVARVQNVAPSQGLLGLLQLLLVAERKLLVGFHDYPMNHRRVRFRTEPAKYSRRSHDDLTSRSFGPQASRRTQLFQSNDLLAHRLCQLFGGCLSSGPLVRGMDTRLRARIGHPEPARSIKARSCAIDPREDIRSNG